MNLIAAVDRNWAIGKGSDLLVDIPEDKKFFREETLGKVVVMGRRTFESLPAGSLDFRTNIVLTKDRKFAPKDVCVCHCVDEVLEMVSVYDTKDVYIIGGQSVYEQFAGLCDTAHITKVDYAYDADESDEKRPREDGGHVWHVHQVFRDSDDDRDFGIWADVDLDATQEEGAVVFANYRVGFVDD